MLKNSLRARLLGRPNWLAELTRVTLGLHAAANLETGVSPSLLVTGQQPALPGQLVVARSNIDNASSFGRELSSSSSSSSVAVSVAGVGDHDLTLFAITCIHKHLRSASSQPGCYTVLYLYSLTTSASFSFDLSCCQQML